MPPKKKKTTPDILPRNKKLRCKRKTTLPPPPPPPLADLPLEEEEEEERVVGTLSVIDDDMAHLEETDEDCYILDFNPNEEPVPPLLLPPPPTRPELPDLNGPPNPFPESPSTTTNYDVDLAVIADKGQVACRDFPHSRHECVKFPFRTTPHKKHCQLCYCFVCDLAAPCSYWTNQYNRHCDAENVGHWKNQRELKRKVNTMKKNNERAAATSVGNM